MVFMIKKGFSYGVLSKLKFSKYSPNVFTEHGTIMAASILNTSRAVGEKKFRLSPILLLKRNDCCKGEK